MPKKKKHDDDLFDHLRARGVRKRLAKAVAKSGGKSRKKVKKLARAAMSDLRSAADAIRRDAKLGKAHK
jgi:hypothetical protein